MNRLDPGHIVHISVEFQQYFTFWRIVSLSHFMLLPLFMVHSIHMPHAILE